MASRRLLAVWLAVVFSSMGATYRTPNFTVEAPSAEIAQQIGQYAEYYRKQKALDWTGREMPQWSQPCPIKVTVTQQGAGGATSFIYDQGQVFGQQMNIEGSVERLLNSVLPHEVTHTVFAHYFRRPVPRWADEGGSVLSEDDTERNRHDQLVREILNTPGRAIPLRRLLPMKEYPKDVLCLYAEGYSVTNFLVGQSSRPAFLQFVNQAMRDGWDAALVRHYRYNNVEELEQVWLTHLKKTKKGEAQLTSAEGGSAGRVIVRLTVPPVQPLDDSRAPTFRSQSPEREPEPLGWNQTPRGSLSQPSEQGRPWTPNPIAPPTVRLGAPVPLQPLR